ncbi:RNA polymerase I associated factor, A49-like protein [Serendipita vermifera]|nr:RNA polymerase I associated factor, A49-like protein [Serendipita vermifera]
MSTTNSKKRKRPSDENELYNVSAKIITSTESLSKVGPAFAIFNAIEPPDNAIFDCYIESENDREFSSAKSLIVSETETVQFISNNKDKRDSDFHCHYLVGVRNRRTNQLVIRPAPIFLVGHHVKSGQSLDAASQAQSDYTQARNQLGKAFGTKKAQAAISRIERNKVDVKAMDGVSDILQQTIKSKTDTLPTELQKLTDGEQSIPRYNQDAAVPAEIYPIEYIVSDAELQSIAPSKLKASQLPFKYSTWINTHIQNKSAHSNKDTKLELRIIFYISSLFLFRTQISKPREKVDLQESLFSIPDAIVETMINQFTESPRDSTRVQSTPQKETKLLTHALALCLRVDHFACDPSVIASDLRLSPNYVKALFKSIGCKITSPNRAEQIELGLTIDQASEKKLAILRAPLVLPAPSKRH